MNEMQQFTHLLQEQKFNEIEKNAQFLFKKESIWLDKLLMRGFLPSLSLIMILSGFLSPSNMKIMAILSSTFVGTAFLLPFMIMIKNSWYKSENMNEHFNSLGKNLHDWLMEGQNKIVLKILKNYADGLEKSYFKEGLDIFISNLVENNLNRDNCEMFFTLLNEYQQSQPTVNKKEEFINQIMNCKFEESSPQEHKKEKYAQML